MFGKVVYYDQKTIDEYKAFITGNKTLDISSVEMSNKKDAGISIQPISLGASADKKYAAKVVPSILFDCNEFEKLLAKRSENDFFDLTLKDDYDLKTIEKGSIIKIDAYISIPESFDLMVVLKNVLPFLKTSIPSFSGENGEVELLNYLLGGMTSARIPIIADADDCVLCSQIISEYIISGSEGIEVFEDFEGESFTILARISSSMKSATKPFYDPYKDFMKINRALRRTITDRDDTMKPICVDTEYRLIDILAIYR